MGEVLRLSSVSGQFIRFSGLLTLLALAFLPVRTSAQGVRSIIQSSKRVFPSVGAGVKAIRRGADGRYYVLARPANAIRVYSAAGKLIGQIPKPGSGAAIRYAVGIDLTSAGMIAVADRGANSIDVFRPDGSLVSRTPVFAPTSVVALADGEFAVTTLRSRRLVQVIDQRGSVVERFGDPTDVRGNPDSDVDAETEELFGGPAPKTPALHDYGTITGDSSGGIYFAFASTPNPTLRKYDRNGYEAYQASISKSDFGGGAVQPADRLQLLFGLSNVSFSSQEGGWLRIGSSGNLKFGANVGQGFGQSLYQGYGFAQAAQQQTMSEMGSNGALGGPQGSAFAAQVTDAGSKFQLGSAPAIASRGGRANSGQFGEKATNSGALLQFSGSNDNSNGTDDSFDSGDSGGTQSSAIYPAGNSTDESSSAWLGPPGAQGGLPGQFVIGSGLNGLFLRPPGLSPAITGAPASGTTTASKGTSSASGASTHTASSSTTGTSTAALHPGYHGGGFNAGALMFTAGLRLNLGKLDRGVAVTNPKITAVAVDPQTHDVWAAIADTLVEFNSNGNPVGMYYLTLAGGESLHATALLVEPNRLLIASDPWGIYEFPRPDEPAAPQSKSKVVPQVAQPR